MLDVKDILGRTRDIINEYVPTGDDFSEESDELLLSHIVAAARMTVETVPLHTLVPKCITFIHSDDSDSESDGESAGETPVADVAEETYDVVLRPDRRYYLLAQLPSDYVRLGYIRMLSGNTVLRQHQPITQLLPTLHPLYAQQYTQVSGLGAGEYHPRAFVKGKEIEIHSVPILQWNTLQVELCYIPMPTVVNGAIEVLGDTLLELVSLRTAALYLGLTGDSNAEAALAAADKMLESITNN